MTFERKNAAQGNTGFGNDTPDPLKGFASAGRAEFDQTAQQAQQGFSDTNQSQLRSIFAQNTSGPLSRFSGSVRLSDLLDRSTKLLKTVEGSPLVLNAIKIDSQLHGVFLSSVVIAGRDRANPDTVFAYTLLLEREEPIDAEVRTQPGGFKTVIPVVSGTAWDKKYAEAVQSVVAQQLNVDPSNVRAFSACVVPKDLDLGNIESSQVPESASNLLYNAVFAINTQVEEAKGLEDFALAATAQNEVMTIEPKFSRALVKDLSGREKRGDINLQFKLKQTANTKGQSLNDKAAAAEKRFGDLSGYIDFIPVQTEGQVTGGWGTTAQVQQKFSPLLVITSMFTEQAGSLRAQLAMLMAAATMAHGDEWVNSLYERHLASKRAGDKIDIGEIGALNIEVNLPQYRPQEAQGINQGFGPIVDTRNADVDRSKYISLIQQLCNQDMYIALDAPNAGAESWYMDKFRASAATGSDLSRLMSQQIFEELQGLTGGRFAAEFQSITRNTQLWLTEPVQIHNGYYVNASTGERRDIRDVDTLTIANILGPTDPTAPSRWGATFLPGVDTERALTERKEMIEMVCGGQNNVHYTGYSTRLMLNPAVVTALLRCAAAVQFNIRFVSTYSSGLTGFGSSAFNFGGARGLSSANVNSNFRGGFNGNQGNVLSASNFTGQQGMRI